MAQPLDASFGAGFDATAFRTAIKNTMMMGLPNAVEKRATFRWKTKKTFDKHDSGGNPYNFESQPLTVTAKDDVQIPVAVEFVDSQALTVANPAGQIESPKIKVTVLDDEFPSVQGADLIVLDGASYEINFVEPPQGLFTVTIYIIHATAFDES